MKICVFGAGSIGGLLAARLADVAGVDLSIIARGSHLNAIREKGLTLHSLGETKTVQLIATEDPKELGAQDVVFNCLKAHQAWASADDFLPLLGPNTSVVTCQNGVPWWYFYKIGGAYEGRQLDAVDRGGRQWTAIGPERAIGCSLYPAAECPEPGLINHVFGDKIALGEPSGELSERTAKIATLLEAAGFNAPVLEDIRSEIWMKLWGNLCFNPISALTGATLDVMATDPGTKLVAKAMMIEAQAIGEQLGASFRVDIDQRIKGAAGVGAHRTSMLQDLDAGKAMEIDALVTAVQEMGQVTGIETPNLNAVLALVQQLGRMRGLYPTYPA